MAFFRYADARVVHPQVTRTQWQNIRTAAKRKPLAETDISNDLIHKASEYLGATFDPKDYLLTHCTIVASVNTFTPATNASVGSFIEDGFRVIRKYSSYRITPETDKFINHNFDAWSREVLLKSYRTFIGGFNFVEHVQVEALSKGRIIDACARDIGDSIYIDILIATDRKHTELIGAIKSGKMSTLSMGCVTASTTCTKCGHVAADETELCPHIKYEKGNIFYDEKGRKHRIAELCGHESLDPTAGVTFVEASWVETPAFTGAVLRNILDPDPGTAKKVLTVLASPVPRWAADANTKAANVRLLPKTFSAKKKVVVAGWADEDPAEGPGDGLPPDGETPPTTETEPLSPFKDLEEDLYKGITKKVKQRFQDDLKKIVPADVSSHAPTESTNENLNKVAKNLYEAGLEALVKTASSDVALINSVAAYNESVGVKIPVELYRVALDVGNPVKYSDAKAYKKACHIILGEKPTLRETQVLLRLGKLLFKRKSLEEQ